MAVNVNWYSLEIKQTKKKEWKELICNESLQRSYKEWVEEECPRAAANTMLQWDLSWHFWQHSCTQFTFHWNQWEVVIPGKAAHQLGLRRNDCRKCQAPVWHPAVYLSSHPYLCSQEKSDVITLLLPCLLNARAAATLSSSLYWCSRLCRRWTSQLCFTFLGMFYSGDDNAILTLFCSHILLQEHTFKKKTCYVKEQTAFWELLRSFIAHANTFSEWVCHELSLC